MKLTLKMFCDLVCFICAEPKGNKCGCFSECADDIKEMGYEIGENECENWFLETKGVNK